jgi:hypothetical protein
MNDYQYSVGPLIELRNNALLLTIGNEHLKEDVFLAKIGNSISRSVEVLEKDITALKKEYPGKFMNEVDTDSILEKIDSIAQRLLNPSKETRNEHASGQLGREVEAYTGSIARAVDDMRMKIKGSPADHAGGGPAGNIIVKVKDIFLSAGGLLNWGLKILGCIIVMLATVFCYFYFTMEKDTKFLNEIVSSQASLKEKKVLLPKLQKEKQGLEDKRKAWDREMTREERLSSLDLELKIKKVDSNIDQVEAEISVYEQKLKENQDKLEALRKKPFMTRLLKR